jgi:Ala-tRNA(Pro) deacylase
MANKKLIEFLEKNRTNYELIPHMETHTALQTAAATHIPGKEIAKTVIFRKDGDLAMAVLPASYLIDFNKLKKVIGCSNCELVTEQEFKDLFPECETGAMPPFGNLWNMETFVSESLTGDVYIAFNAGNHREAIKMTYMDFAGLVNPIVLQFSEKMYS